MALPEYVTRKAKKNGRIYFYYQRYRGTENAWPIFRLPNYDDLQEFALRYDQYSRLSNDNGNWEYTCGNNQTHELLEPNPKKIHEFWEKLDKLDQKGYRLSAFAGLTFYSLIEQYKDSTKYKKLADSTKVDYDKYLDQINDAWADEPVAALTTIVAQEAIDCMADTPAAARYFRAVFRTLVQWGIPRGFHTSNPVAHTEAPEKGEPYSPWPDWAFELFFEKARKDMIWPVFTALFSGQRQIDVIKMIKPRSGANAIMVTAQKTKKFVPVPVHPNYAALLELFPKGDNIQLHLMENGDPWTLSGYRTAWQREMNRPEFIPFRENRLVFHGLRKNAVGTLAEAGATDSEISVVVGMSLQMVAHYSQDAKLKNIAQNCFNRIKDDWGNAIPNTLPTAEKLGGLGTFTPKLGTKNK